MEQIQKTSTRKKFLYWGTALVSVITLSRFINPVKKASTISCSPPPDTVKMLAEDGSLVEIDKKLLVSSGKKISNKELQVFIKK
jgi:hypothetical protein